MPEALSKFQEIDLKTYKEFNKFKHLEYFSHFNIKNEGITLTTQALLVKGINVVNSLNTLGGLQTFFPIFKDSYLDQELVLELLTTFEIFSRSSLLASLLSRDFFDILGNALEINALPSQELLDLLHEILENLS